MHDVLVVYKQVEMLFDKDGNLLPYDGQFTHTISYDEKPNIQAIGGAKDRAPIQGKGHWQRDCEYTRHGTLYCSLCLAERRLNSTHKGEMA